MCVCFSMFVNAALSSALRAAGGPASHPNVSLNLPRPSEGADVQPDGRREDPPAYRGDLSVSRPAGFLSSPPPAVGPLASVQIRFRSELQDSVQALLSPSAAPGPSALFGGVLKSMVPKIVDRLVSPALPMVTEDAFVAIFAAASLLGPKSVPSVRGRPLVRQSYVVLVKAAVAF